MTFSYEPWHAYIRKLDTDDYLEAVELLREVDAANRSSTTLMAEWLENNGIEGAREFADALLDPTMLGSAYPTTRSPSVLPRDSIETSASPAPMA